MKHLLLLPLTVTFFLSCRKDSSDVNQDKIFQSYRIVYDAETDKTSFYAEFYENTIDGKKLILGRNSTVTIDGQNMSRVGKTYAKTVEGHQSLGIFLFTDANGHIYHNTVYGAKPISNSNDHSVDRGQSNHWEFGGQPVSTGEQIMVKIYGYSSEAGLSVSTTSETGINYVTLLVSDMTELIQGDAIAVTERYHSFTNGDWGSVGGLKTSVYLSKQDIIWVN